MLSAVVIVPTQPVRGSSRTLADAMVRTLASLVPAAIEGVLRDVTIAAPSGHSGMERIADHAGCELIEAENQKTALLKALNATRESNVFLIPAGRAPETGFADELAEMIGDGMRLARMRERPYNFATRLFPAIAPVSAVLAPREALAAVAANDFRAIVSGLGRAPTLRIRARRVD